MEYQKLKKRKIQCNEIVSKEFLLPDCFFNLGILDGVFDFELPSIGLEWFEFEDPSALKYSFPVPEIKEFSIDAILNEQNQPFGEVSLQMMEFPALEECKSVCDNFNVYYKYIYPHAETSRGGLPVFFLLFERFFLNSVYEKTRICSDFYFFKVIRIPRKKEDRKLFFSLFQVYVEEMFNFLLMKNQHDFQAPTSINGIITSYLGFSEHLEFVEKICAMLKRFLCNVKGFLTDKIYIIEHKSEMEAEVFIKFLCYFLCDLKIALNKPNLKVQYGDYFEQFKCFVLQNRKNLSLSKGDTCSFYFCIS